MDVTIDQIARFKKMMEGVADQRNCTIRWTHTSEEKMEFSISHDDYEAMSCMIYWADASSLTDAGVRTWACYFEHRLKRRVPEGVAGIQFDTAAAIAYVTADTHNTMHLYHQMNNRSMPQITKVIYSGPATIVFWSDKTKTVVKCQDGDEFDAEKGLAMAISKRVLGNQGNYYNTFSKWLPKEE